MTEKRPSTPASLASQDAPSHRTQRLAIAGAVVLAGALVLVATRFFPTHATPPPRERLVEAPPRAGSATLFFGSTDSARLEPEARNLAMPDNPSEKLRLLVRELAAGPMGADSAARPVAGRARLLPAGTALRGAYVLDSGETLCLDFARDFRNSLGGGSTHEYLVLKSLCSTVRAAMPSARRLQILIEGQVVESLGGHYDVSSPLDLDAWTVQP